MASTSLAVNGITIGFYPDEGDAGGTKSYLSDLNAALARSSPDATCTPTTIGVVGWYAQTYPGERFDGFQLMPLVDDLTREYQRTGIRMVYEASVMPFQSWRGYTADDNSKAHEVAQVMQAMLEKSRVEAAAPAAGGFAIAEIRLRFGHEVNYYIQSGLYPPPTRVEDPGWDYRTAFDQVALACRRLAPQYAERIKMFWCPNIASTSSGAEAEYRTFLPTLQNIDYVGIDYYCPSPGNLDAADFVRKMRKVHDRYACESRPFLLGETGLHFDAAELSTGAARGHHHQATEVYEQAKLKWLEVVTGKEVGSGLKWMQGVSWFNYEKDRDYRLVWVARGDEAKNRPLLQWLQSQTEVERRRKAASAEKARAKAKGFWKTLLAK